MLEDGMRKRVSFAKDLTTNHSGDIWTSSIALYLDGVSFYYKRNRSIKLEPHKEGYGGERAKTSFRDAQLKGGKKVVGVVF